MSKTKGTKQRRSGSAGERKPAVEPEPAGQGGRPTLLTPAVEKALVQAIRAGNYLAAAARSQGLTPGTVERWLRWGRAAMRDGRKTSKFCRFCAAVTRAKAQHQLEVVATLHKAMVGYTAVKTKTVTDKGGHSSSERTETEMFHPELALEFLARTDPRHWGRRDRHEISSGGSQPTVIQVVTGYDDRAADTAGRRRHNGDGAGE